MSSIKILSLFVFLAIAAFFVLKEGSLHHHVSGSTLPKLRISYSLSSFPEVLEQEVTAPLENAISRLTNIKEISSESGHDRGVITVSFDEGVPMDLKEFEVVSIVRNLYPKLHPEVSYPTVEVDGSVRNKDPFLIYRISSSLPIAELKKRVEEMYAVPLLRQPGIADVSIVGSQEKQVVISIDPTVASRLHTSLDEICRLVEEQFTRSYFGTVEAAHSSVFFLKTAAPETTLELLKAINIPIGPGSIPLDEVADVFIEEVPPSGYFRVNGQHSVGLIVYSDGSLNSILLGRDVKKLLPQTSADLRTDLEYDSSEFDRVEFIKDGVRALVIFLCVGLLVLLFFRDGGSRLSLLGGYAGTGVIAVLAVYLCDLGVTRYSISGIIASIGFGVLSPTLVLCYLRQGYSSGYIGTRLACVGAALMVVEVLIISYLPEQDLFLVQSIQAAAIVIVSSTMASIVFVPPLFQLHRNKYKKPESPVNTERPSVVARSYPGAFTWAAKYKPMVVVLLLLTFGVPLFLLPEKWDNHPWYNSSFGSPVYREDVRPYLDKWLGGALYYFVRNKSERSGQRLPEGTKLYVNVSLPPGNTLSEMNSLILRVEEQLTNVVGIKNFISEVWTGQRARVTILFDELNDRSTLPAKVQSNLIRYSLNWDGADWDIFGVGHGFSSVSGRTVSHFHVDLKGYNYEELSRHVTRISEKLVLNKHISKVNTNEDFQSGEGSLPVFSLTLDKQKLLRLGVNSGIVAGTILAMADTRYPNVFVNVGDVRVRTLARYSASDKISVYETVNNSITSGGRRFNLSALADISLDEVAKSIRRQNRSYIRSIGFDYIGSEQSGREYLASLVDELNVELPEGFSVEGPSGRRKQHGVDDEVFFLFVLCALAFTMCVVFLEQLTLALIAWMAIPCSYIGVFILFSTTSVAFGDGGYAAYFLLGALSVNLSIFSVTWYKQQSTSGMQRYTFLASPFMKIILFMVACFCSGLLSFLFFNEDISLWAGFSAGMIAGLGTLGVYLLVVIPVFMIDRSQLNPEDYQVGAS